MTRDRSRPRRVTTSRTASAGSVRGLPICCSRASACRPTCSPSWCFFSAGCCTASRRTQVELTRLDFALRLSGFVATLVTSCALAYLHFSSTGFSHSAGGIIGQALGGWLESLMKLLGASVLLFCIWVASISLFLGVSWIRVHGSSRSADAARLRTSACERRRVARPGRRPSPGGRAPGCRESGKGAQVDATEAANRAGAAVAGAERARREGAPGTVCSIRRLQASCRRCHCSTIHRNRRPVIPKNRSRRCRAWSS